MKLLTTVTYFTKGNKSWNNIVKNICSRRCYSRNVQKVKPEPVFHLCAYLQFLQTHWKDVNQIPPSFRETFGRTSTVCADNIYILNEISDQISTGCNDLHDLVEMCATETDAELKKAANEEACSVKTNVTNFKHKLIENLINMQTPIESSSKCNEALIEVYAGVGGSESMIFAEELMNMYINWCRNNGFQFTFMETDAADFGIRKAVASISGSSSLYELLKTEGGVHRVQRVPDTEKRGRMHTSTASVAVFPAEEDVDDELDDKELIIKAVRKAAGGGGQHVNKTESAIRITHIPTGFVVECNASRYQPVNMHYARKRLQAKLTSTRNSQQESDVMKARKQQIKNNERSDKLRTYNFQQDKVTDHRIGKTVNGVTKFLSGGDELTQFMQEIADKNSQTDFNSTIDILLNEGKSVFQKDWTDVTEKANLMTLSYNSVK